MKHFSLTNWADFVRGVMPPNERANMQKHLDEGCTECRKTLNLWGLVTDFAKREATYSPPASVIRLSESFIVPFISYLRDAHGFHLAKLTFDSFEHRQVGLRGLDMAPRLLMYQHDHFFIDMRVEPEPMATDEIFLAGQVVNALEPSSGVEAVPVSLFADREALGSTTTNELGEFRMSFRAGKHLRVLFVVEHTGFLTLLPDSLVEIRQS